MRRCGTFQNANNKDADRTARMRRLVCAFVDRQPPKTGFLATKQPCHHRAMMAQTSQIKTQIIRSVTLLDMPAWVFYKRQMRIILLCDKY